MEDLELQTKVTEMLQQEKSQLRDTIHDLEVQSRSLDSKLLNEKVANDRFKIIFKEQSIELTETQQKLLDLQNDYSQMYSDLCHA